MGSLFLNFFSISLIFNYKTLFFTIVNFELKILCQPKYTNVTIRLVSVPQFILSYPFRIHFILIYLLLLLLIILFLFLRHWHQLAQSGAINFSRCWSHFEPHLATKNVAPFGTTWGLVVQVSPSSSIWKSLF